MAASLTRRYNCLNVDCEVGIWTAHGGDFGDNSSDCFMCHKAGTLYSFSGTDMIYSGDVEIPAEHVKADTDWSKINTIWDVM